ncbi:DUF2249 domain-containing protein [Microbacterium sp.]|uniref:DUF2249 domain-containing protein n=1 Tax=Microbacterium sp. TaxID=51671 RepID=UPI003A95A1C0
MADIEIHGSKEEAAQSSHATDCTCGELNEDLPEMDVQQIPHAIRHAMIFGAVDALKPGAGLIISASHAPMPLLAQLELRYGDKVTATFVEKGPERWRVLLRRAA